MGIFISHDGCGYIRAIVFVCKLYEIHNLSQCETIQKVNNRCVIAFDSSINGALIKISDQMVVSSRKLAIWFDAFNFKSVVNVNRMSFPVEP